MAIFRKKTKPRVCVIGLDGVPHPLLQDLAERDVMPTFKDLISSGHLHNLKASLPEISSVSWSDFMTGTNPGTHGIFGFTELKPGGYDLRFPNYLDVKAPAIWDKLGRKKKRSIIINQPSTYPARRIDGMLVSGFVAIDLAKAVYPPALKSRLEGLDYQIDIDTFRCREDHEFLWKDLALTLKGREQAFDSFWPEDWDYFEFVITGTDRVQHFLWDAYQDKEHPHHQRLLDYYHEVDRVVGRVADAFERSTGSRENLFLLSDHGFTGIRQEVYLNAWLEQEGYLSFKSPEPQGIGDITPESRAFALDPNRIHIHLEGRYPEGRVPPGEKAALKQEISQKLSGLRYEDDPVIDRIFDCEEIYSGPWVSKGPDLIALARHGFDMKGSVKKKAVFGRSVLQGMHTWDDAYFWASADHGPDLRISDLSEIILKRF